MADYSDDKYLNKSLKRALSVIDLFDPKEDELSITEIARELGTKPGSIYPTLYTLEKEAYLHRDGSKKYRLGLKFLEKGSLVLEKMDLRTQARPELEKLRDETNETIHLGILDEGKIVYIDKLEPRRVVRMYSSIGKRVPVHATALGKAILAYLSPKKVEKIIEKQGLPRYSQNTITSFAELKRELGKVKEQGYAIDNGEYEEEIRCMATPVFKHTGSAIAALSVTTPASRVSREEIEELAPTAMKYSHNISQKMGWDKGIRHEE